MGFQSMGRKKKEWILWQKVFATWLRGFDETNWATIKYYKKKNKDAAAVKKDHRANIIPWSMHHISTFSNRTRQQQLRLLVFQFEVSIDITYRMTLQRQYNNSLIWDKNLPDCTEGIHRNKCHLSIHAAYNKFIMILAKKSISKLRSKFIDLLFLSEQTDFQLNCWIYLKPQVHTSWNIDLIVWKWGNYIAPSGQTA